MTNDAPGRRSGTGAGSAAKHLPAKAGHDQPADEGAPERAAHTILVVDDHPAARYAATKMLQALGYRTAEAESGSEALLADTASVSGVLLDVNLPDVNGVKVCEQLKATSSGLPVVLMSSVYVDELHRDAAFGAGADGYLTSPLDAGELGAIFDRLLAAAPRP